MNHSSEYTEIEYLNNIQKNKQNKSKKYLFKT